MRCVVHNTIGHAPNHAPLQLSHLRADFDQEKGAMEETVRGLTREVWLHQLVIDSYIPDQYQQLIHSHSTWNEDTGEWHLVGNNTQSSDNLSLSLSLPERVGLCREQCEKTTNPARRTGLIR